MKRNMQFVIIALVGVVHIGVAIWLIQYAPARRAASSGVTALVTINLAPYEDRVSNTVLHTVASRSAAKTRRQALPVSAPLMLPINILPAQSTTQSTAQLISVADMQPVSESAQSIASVSVAAATRSFAKISSPPRFDAVYLNNPAPHYPTLAKRLGEQGKVMLRVLVNAAGQPQLIELQTSSGSERLDIAAIEAVKRWQFIPAREGNAAVDGVAIVPIHFQLS